MKRLLGVVCVLLTAGMVLLAQSPKPAEGIGTWRLNLSKSKWSPGPAQTAPVADLRQFENRKDGYTVVTITGVNAQGDPTFQQIIYKLDGKDYPQYTSVNLAEFAATGAKPGTTSVKLIDDYSVSILTKNAQGVASAIPIIRSVSKDGKTMTMTTKGTNARGVTVENILVYDRVH